VSETSNEWKRALSELIETTYPEPGEHPSAERWLAYQRGGLAAEEEARLEEHLVRCRDCFDLAQAAADFSAGETAGGDEEDAVAARGVWSLVRREIENAAPAAGSAPAALPLKRTRRHPSPYLLAAVLSMALVGSAAWNVVEQREIAALRAPRPDALIVEIAAGERGTVAETTVPAGGPWTLVLHPRVELPVYRLEIRDAASGRRVGSYALRLDPDVALTLALPAGLPPGRYRLELSAGEFRQPHLLRVTEAGRGG
jgi:hypothetical protein